MPYEDSGWPWGVFIYVIYVIIRQGRSALELVLAEERKLNKEKEEGIN